MWQGVGLEGPWGFERFLISWTPTSPSLSLMMGQVGDLRRLVEIWRSHLCMGFESLPYFLASRGLVLSRLCRSEKDQSPGNCGKVEYAQNF
jgi:hypothetical protein